jgi:hypothetical protein
MVKVDHQHDLPNTNTKQGKQGTYNNSFVMTFLKDSCRERTAICTYDDRVFIAFSN